MTLSTARSEETRSDQLITNINKHIQRLDMILNTIGFHRDQDTKTNYYIEVLNRAINFTEKYRSLKDINSILAAAEEEAIKSII
jgi:enoyl-[acyl-carrier-protein] reductase (NADH)